VSTGNKSTDGNGHVETSNRALIQDSALVRNPSNNTAACETESRVSTETFRSARVAIGESDVCDLNHQRNLQNFSKLSYVSICIQGVTGNHDALNDSGSQVKLIKRDLLQQLPEIQTTGRVSIKCIVGPAIETDLALLDIKPAPTEVGCTNIAPSLREIFAVCDELNEDIILTADTVKRLSTLNDYDALIAVNQATVTDVHNTTANVNVQPDVSDANRISSVISLNSDDDKNDKTDYIDVLSGQHTETDLTSAETVTLIKEQSEDPNLKKYFDKVKNGNKMFFIRDGILYHRGKVQGNRVEQLCLPERRIETVLKLAHDLPVSGHQAVHRTNDRISLSFFFPRQLQRVKQYCDSCNVCQLRARERRTDLVPIKPIERHEENFGHLQADLIGPMGSGKYQYTLVHTDVQSRYVTAFELTAPSAKNVLDKLLIHCSYFGLPRYISFDCGSLLTSRVKFSELTKACLERLGVSPRFHCPYNPRAAGLVERSNTTLKQIISKLIADMPSTWHKVLPFALWSIRTSVNETLGISPYQAVFSQLARGPLQLLCDHLTGKKPLPLDFAKSPAQYLEQLENKLQLAVDYSAEHAAREQTRYVHNYNLRSRDKSFEVGERVIYLMPTSANKLTRT
jgi:hypothetical protein